ncbi:centromere protein F [Elgaria multicarinata webbii]|uniref:centromere protein F n=1 Tax=Elgaria multicarinata webbii TaxID=159646 RepID=UPI002FCD1402
MSWAVEEWKEGLSTRVLHKIQELESHLDKLKKERQQRQFQLESLEAALQKQKQKVENEKNEGATLKRENQNLMELCDNLEKSKQKLSHELQVKESQVNFQEGQLISSKKQIERLEQELKRYKSELERSQKTLTASDASFNGTPQKTLIDSSMPSHSDSESEELQVKYNNEVEEKRRPEAELKSMKSQKTNPLHPENTISRREIARQQASSSVFSWQQEKTPSRTSSSCQETPVSSGSTTSHFPWEFGATPSHKDLNLAKKEFSVCRDSPLNHQMKIQNQELRSRIQELDHKLQIQTQEMKFSITKLQETQLQLGNMKMELIEKDKALNKSRNEVTRITAQLDQTLGQFAAKEEKVKKLSDELNCQRQNSDSAQRSLQQKMKEKEKEHQEELSLQVSQVKVKLQGELHEAKNSYNLLHAELEKTLSAKKQLEKNANDFTQKLSCADQAMQTMQLKENELKRTCEEVKQQNSLLSNRSAQQLQEICQLKEELRVAKQLLQQSQNFSEDMKNKNSSLEIELKLFEEKLKKQDNPLSLEKMKLAVSILENQRDSLQQLLKQKDNIIEELRIKVEDLKTLQQGLAECEGLKKETELLSQWKKESEQLLNQLRLEKEGLVSKICSLESAVMTEKLKSNEKTKALESEDANLRVEIKTLKCVVEDKTTELVEQKKAYVDLQQKNAMSEEKHRKERENNLLKLSEFTKQVDVLQKKLQSAANEVLDKEKCIAALETSLASHAQLNACFQKQCEEQAQARDETERKLAEAQQRQKDFAWETGQHISKLQASVSEKQDLLDKVLAALEEKDKKLQVLIKELGRQQAVIQDLKIDNASLEDSAQQLKVMSQTISQKEPDLSGAISLNEKKIEGVNDDNSSLRCAVRTLEQKNLDLIERNLYLSNSLKEREVCFLELSERQREKCLLVSKAEGLERECTSLAAKNENLECALREQACQFKGERNEFESREKQLLYECEELHGKLMSLEGKNNLLLSQLGNIQPVSEEAEILRQDRAAQNNMQHPDSVLLQENKQLTKELKIRNEHGVFTLHKTSMEYLEVSVEEKEDELHKYQVKLELLQMDLEDKEVSVEYYADQVKQLEAGLRAMEIKMEESEMEKERLKYELQSLKQLQNPTSEITEQDENDQSPASFRAVTRENFYRQIDAKCSSVPRDLLPSQNDYVQLVSSVHMTMSKLNELEKMCEHLQIEKSTLASQLKYSEFECFTNADTMAQELMDKMNEKKEKRTVFSVELIDQCKMGAQSDIDRTPSIAVECCDGLEYEYLKLSNEQIKAHFDGVKEKAFSLKNEYNILQGQTLSMVSKISELQCYMELLKEENTRVSKSFNQVDTASFTMQVTPSLVDKEFQLDGKFCMEFPCFTETNGRKLIGMDSDFDSEQYKPSNEIGGPNSGRQDGLEGTLDQHHQYLAELYNDDAWVFPIKPGLVVSKKRNLQNRVEHLLCKTYEKSFEMIEESFRCHKNLEDEEIQKIQELLLSARKEVDGLRKQTVSDNEQWQQRLNRVILQVASELPAEKKPGPLPQEQKEPQLPLQGLDLSSRTLLFIDTERQVQIPSEQENDASCHQEIYASSNQDVLETVGLKAKVKTHEAIGTEDQTSAYKADVSIKSTEKCLPDLDTESKNAAGECIKSSNCPDELSFPPNINTSTMPVNFLENHSTIEMPQLHINQAYSNSSSHDVEEGNERIDNLLMRVQYLNSDLDSKDKELVEKRTVCAELDKRLITLEQEKEDLSEVLKSITFDNQQLTYNLMTLGVELNKVKSDLEMYKMRLSDTTDILEDLEMTKADWVEKLLEAENEVRRIKSEKANIESHALSMEGDVEELQSKKEQLEKEIEKKLKIILGLQDQLCIISGEKKQFSQELSALSKGKEEQDQVCQKMQETIKELESSQMDSAEFIRILEAEAKTQAKLLESARVDADRLSTERDCLVLQLQKTGKLVEDLVLEKETAENLISHLCEEKEVSLRECETLRSKLSISEMENAKISKSLEGSLIEKGELAARLNSAQEEADDLRRGIEKLKIKIESDEKSRRRLAEKLKDRERKDDRLVDQIESLEREVQMSEENLENAIVQAEAAKAEAEEANAEIEKLHVSLRSLECEMNALQAENECVGRKLEENQDKVSNLEVSNATLLKQLGEREKEKVQIRGDYESTLLAMESQLKQACEEIRLFHSKQETCKAKEQDLINEVVLLKNENTQLVHYLEEAKCKHSEIEQLVEALLQEFHDFEQKLDENDSFSEHLPKDETLQTLLEDLQVTVKPPEDELEVITSVKYSFLGKQIVQLKEKSNSFRHMFQQWLDTYRELKQGKRQMVKQIHELETQLKMADACSHRDVAAEEIRLELEGLRESLEEKTTEADQNLEKYCALIINHHKLEEENEMLRTQVSLLNTWLKQSPSATGSPSPHPGRPTKVANGQLAEKASPEDIAKITAERQTCQENKSSGRKASSLLEASAKIAEKETTFHQHGSAVPQDNTEQESDGSPEVGGEGFSDTPPSNSSSCISHRTYFMPRTSPCLISPSLSSPPFTDNSVESNSLSENIKATAEGSKLPKVNDAQLQEIQTTGSPLGFTPRSALSACNQSPQALPERSAEYLTAVKTRPSLSTEENELDEACHVQ